MDQKIHEPYDYMRFSETLGDVMRRRGFANPNQLAKAMGKPRTQITHHLQGGNNPTLKTFLEFCNTLGVSADELLGVNRSFSEYIDDDELKMIEQYRGLPEEQKALFSKFLAVLTESETEN